MSEAATVELRRVSTNALVGGGRSPRRHTLNQRDPQPDRQPGGRARQYRVDAAHRRGGYRDPPASAVTPLATTTWTFTAADNAPRR